MLLSIQLSSNRPNNLEALVKNLEDTASNPQEIEVIINIDEGDDLCKNSLDLLKSKSPVNIKYIQTNIIKSFKDVAKVYNYLLPLTNRDVKFVTLFSDEYRFKTKGWDDIIKKYVGYYEDNIFRIRLSRYRFRNYLDFWECIFAPDSVAFYTKKWMDIVGMWCPCVGPDSWQQLVSFYLINSCPFDHIQYNRDIPEPFLEFEGEGAGEGLTQEELYKRNIDNVDSWFETVSYEMQKKAKYAAGMLQAHIMTHKTNKNSPRSQFKSNKIDFFFNEVKIEDDKKKSTINIIEEKSRKIIHKIPYDLRTCPKSFLPNEQ